MCGAMSALHVPLGQAQIDAAARLQARLGEWQRAERALTALADSLPGFDSESVLLKVVAVDALYSTNIFVFMRMAQHVEAVLAEASWSAPAWALVDDIGNLEPIAGKPKKRYFSFASKFAHFFIDSERFPILDQYAEDAVRHHLGALASKESHRYRAFVENITTLRRLAALKCSGRELDRYLWLAGQHRLGASNTELRQLLAEPAEDVKVDLVTLTGSP